MEPNEALDFANRTFKRSRRPSPLSNITHLQDRLIEESLKAKGTALAAICRAFDTLEERKRILRKVPHPDVVLASTPKRSLVDAKPGSPPGTPGKVVKGQKFPEPREPEPEPGEGISFGVGESPQGGEGGEKMDGGVE